MNIVFLLGIFVIPRYLDRGGALGSKLAAIATGVLLFAYVQTGGLLAAQTGVVPQPARILGPVATLPAAGAPRSPFRLVNSLLLGPLLAGPLGFVRNRILTHPELTAIPLLDDTLPWRDPRRTVVLSATSGTIFSLSFLAAFSGKLVLVP